MADSRPRRADAPSPPRPGCPGGRKSRRPGSAQALARLTDRSGVFASIVARWLDGSDAARPDILEDLLHVLSGRSDVALRLAPTGLAAATTPRDQRAIWWREWLDVAPDAAPSWLEERATPAGGRGPEIDTTGISPELGAAPEDFCRVLPETSATSPRRREPAFRHNATAVQRLMRLGARLGTRARLLADDGPPFEDCLVGYLAKIPGEDTVRILREFAEAATEPWRRDQLLVEAEQRAAEDVARQTRKVEDVCRLWTDHPAKPVTDGDVFRLIRAELGDLRRESDEDRISLAPLFNLPGRPPLEDSVQIYIAHALQTRARGRCTIDREVRIRGGFASTFKSALLPLCRR